MVTILSYSFIQNGYLVVQCPEIVKIAETKQTSGQKINDSGKPFVHIHPVYTKYTKEGQQQPGDRIINGADGEPEICLLVHIGNEEKIN